MSFMTFAYNYPPPKKNNDTVDGRNSKQPPGMVLKPCKSRDIDPP